MAAKTIKPHPIHRFFDWLDRSPIPAWLFYLLLLLIPGFILQYSVWVASPDAQRTIDPLLIFYFIWFAESLSLGHFVTSASKKLLDEYSPFLPYSKKEFAQLRIRFTTIPSGLGSIFFFVGALIGFSTAMSLSQNFPNIVRGMSFLFQAGYTISFGIALLNSTLLIRQLSMIQKFFRDTERIQMSNLVPIYSFSRYTAIIAIWLFFITYVNGALLMPEIFENPVSAASIYVFMALSAAVFYLPLRGINQHLIAQKEGLLKDVHSRIEKTFLSIHAAHDKSDYRNISGLRTMLSALKDERDLIGTVPTWPWRPGTITGLLSALLLPTILSIITGLLESFLGF